MSVRLDFLVSLLVLSTAVLCVLAGNSFRPGLAGLALTYSLQVPSARAAVCAVPSSHARPDCAASQMGQLFQFATRLTSETESIFTSVERIAAPVPPESR